LYLLKGGCVNYSFKYKLHFHDNGMNINQK